MELDGLPFFAVCMMRYFFVNLFHLQVVLEIEDIDCFAARSSAR